MKRTQTRLLSLLLVLAITIGLMPVASAAVAEITSGAAVSVALPIALEKPSYTAYKREVCSFSASVTSWYRRAPGESSYSLMGNTQYTKCTLGYYYRPYVTFTPDSGYRFADGLKFYINGKLATVTERNSTTGAVTAYITLECVNRSDLQIDELTITGVGTPEPGEPGRYYYEVAQRDLLDYTRLTWIETDPAGNVKRYYESDHLDKEDSFTYKAGYHYKALIALEGSIESWATFLNPGQMKVTVNGFKPSYLETYERQCWVELDFGVAKPMINTLSCTVTPPKAGERASYTLTVPSDANYTAEIYYWYDDSEWESLNPGDVFKAGRGYEVNVVFAAKDGYCIPNDAEYYINGNQASAYESSSSGATCASFSFDELPGGGGEEPPVTPKFNYYCTVTPPEAGKKPSYTVTVPNDADYTAEIFEWYDITNGCPLKPNDVFEAGTEYEVVVDFRWNSGSSTSWDDNHYINGEYAFPLSHMGGLSWQIEFDRLPGFPPNSIAEFSCTVTPPQAGQKPSMVATVPNGANYTAEFLGWYGYNSFNKLGANDVFEAGTTYTAMVAFRTKEGYKFYDEATYLINGQAAESFGWSHDARYMLLEFDRLPGVSENACFITIAEPKVGATPDFAPVCRNPDYSVEVVWHELHGGYPMESPRFEKYESYFLEINLTRKNSTVPEYPVCYVNGKEARCFEDLGFGVIYENLQIETGAALSGKVKSYGAADGDITLELIRSNIVYTRTTGNGYYGFSSVPPGTYTLRVSKLNHVPRDYTITVAASNLTQNAEICLIGDVTGDGRVNATDHSRLYAHINNKKPLTDSYALKCADVTGEGKVNATDHSRLYAHINGKRPLF